MAEALIELVDVTIALGGEIILQDVNIKIYPKETIVLIGLSGSGKTVLLKTLAGLYNPLKGEIRIYGQNWPELSVSQKHDLASHVGVQFQKGALFDELDGFANVAYPLREHTKLTEEEIKTRVLECLRAVDLEKAQHLQVHEMSGGMRQRLGIARAIALKPDILFMDDPTAGLDPINSDNMADMILKLKNDLDTTLIVVTHDLMRAFQFAGRIFFVGTHHVLETGSAEQTQKHPDPRVQQYLQGKLTGPLTDAGEL
ncbi:MAG: ABC transporter ATP-binding protein [Pseudobdellovibrionaceae bacterium]